MRVFPQANLRRTAASLLTIAVLAVSAGTARAGGYTACEAPFIFEGAAANIVPIEYLATSADRKLKDAGPTSEEAERLRRLQRTARHLAWLVKLDSWHQPTYGSLGVVAHMFLGSKCDPDDVLARLIRGGASAPIRTGQALVMLQGRIFIEGEEIFLQSRLRGFRRNEVAAGSAGAPSGYFAGEGISVALGGDDHRLRASLPLLDVTFAPRALTFADLGRIDENSAKASMVYPERVVEKEKGKPLRFEPGQMRAFSIQLFDGGEWIKVESQLDGFSGFIKVDRKASAALHATLPELDFLNGLLGFLRVSQRLRGADYPPPPDSAARHARASLARFIASERTTDDVDARALAAVLSGALAATAGDWKKARADFGAAAAAAPYRGAYRNLLGLADAKLCCAGEPGVGFSDPTRAFADSLSLAPNDREALLNLDAFLALLSETANPPAGIDTTRLTERRAVVRKVVSSFE